MAYSIMYLRHGKLVWETNWTVEIPPPRHFVRNGLIVHDANTAIVTDGDGHRLTIEEERKFDA